MCLLLTAVTALAATFTWTGFGSDDDFDTTANWVSVGCSSCYPDDTGDNATVSGDFNVDLITLAGSASMGSLTLSGTVLFGDANGNDPTLKVQSVTINGAEGGTTIKIKQRATVETD